MSLWREHYPSQQAAAVPTTMAQAETNLLKDCPAQRPQLLDSAFGATEHPAAPSALQTMGQQQQH